MLYLPYIDNIFMIWKGTQDQLKTFLKQFNEQHPTIKFDYKISKEQIAFLDTEVTINYY